MQVHTCFRRWQDKRIAICHNRKVRGLSSKSLTYDLFSLKCWQRIYKFLRVKCRGLVSDSEFTSRYRDTSCSSSTMYCMFWESSTGTSWKEGTAILICCYSITFNTVTSQDLGLDPARWGHWSSCTGNFQTALQTAIGVGGQCVSLGVLSPPFVQCGPSHCDPAQDFEYRWASATFTRLHVFNHG